MGPSIKYVVSPNSQNSDQNPALIFLNYNHEYYSVHYRNLHLPNLPSQVDEERIAEQYRIRNLLFLQAARKHKSSFVTTTGI